MFKHNRSFFIAIVAIMFALIFVAMMLDKTMSLALPSGISTAALTLLVTFSICFLFNSTLLGFLAGVLFGVASWVKAYIFGELFTVNPLVSLVPRLAVGIIAFLIYRLILKAFKNKKSKIAQITSMSVGAFFGLAVNTILFLLALNIVKYALGNDYVSVFAIIKIVIFTNILPEYLISIIGVPLVVLGVRRGLKLGVDGDNPKRSAAFASNSLNHGSSILQKQPSNGEES